MTTPASQSVHADISVSQELSMVMFKPWPKSPLPNVFLTIRLIPCLWSTMMLANRKSFKLSAISVT